MERCENVLETLASQLTSSLNVKHVDGACVIETPFLYPDNRIVTLIVERRPDGTIELSDDGYAQSYARVGGVSEAVLKRTALDFGDRFPGIEDRHSELVLSTTEDALLDAVVALIETTQGIASMVERRRIGDTSTRLDRQITRVLVSNNRNYEKRAKVVAGGSTVDVDYNVLPTDTYSQLNLFAWTERLSLRSAESIAFRIERIQESAPIAGYSNRVVLFRDDAALFSGGSEGVRRISETLQNTGAEIISITDLRRVSRVLTA